jgi:hypothetical protein
MNGFNGLDECLDRLVNDHVDGFLNGFDEGFVYDFNVGTSMG